MVLTVVGTYSTGIKMYILGLSLCQRGAVLGLLGDEDADADHPFLEHNLPCLDHHSKLI